MTKVIFKIISKKDLEVAVDLTFDTEIEINKKEMEDKMTAAVILSQSIWVSLEKIMNTKEVFDKILNNGVDLDKFREDYNTYLIVE